MNNDKYLPEALKLPIEQQKEIAKRVGYGSYEKWLEIQREEPQMLAFPKDKQEKFAARRNMKLGNWEQHIRLTHKKALDHINNFKWGVRPEGFTEEDAERFTERCQSGHGTEKIVEAD